MPDTPDTDLAQRLAATQDHLQGLLAERIDRDPQFVGELLTDPTAALAPLIASALGDDGLTTVPVTIDPDAAEEYLRRAEASDDDVRGFDGAAPVPFPDVGGDGGSATTKSAKNGLGSGPTSNVGTAATKSMGSIGLGKSSLISAPKILVDGRSLRITGLRI